ncbi:MAG TPA: radical SAM protein [Thermoproteales archaeon]|nr:radical SAM protein [Thermoproteales archaeon]
MSEVKEISVNYASLLEADARKFEEIGKELRLHLLPKIYEDYELALDIEPELKEGEKEIARTLSLCPECLRLLKAVIFEREGKVWIRKKCPVHGEIEEIYWGDYQLYMRFKEWQFDGKGIKNSQVPLLALCPYNCGLCPRHKSHTALLNLVATNRCDLSCWYCFFFAARAGYVYEPTLEHVRYMLREARKLSPVPPKALQITGGEPLLRDDIVDMVKLAKEEGFIHVQVNTTGIRLAYDGELAKKLRQVGTNVIYMSFDGVTPYTNPKNHWETPYVLDNLRKARLGVVLVPTVVRGVNDHELWDIIRFGAENMDIVRGVNFQPISLTGRVSRAERKKLRITIPETLILIEKQSNGVISREDWYPVPSVAPVSHFIEALTGKYQLTLTTHFACGAATYVFKDEDGSIIPITRFVNVEEFFKYLEEKASELERGKNKYLIMLDFFIKLRKFVDQKNAPKSLKKGKEIVRLLYQIFVKHDYSSLGKFHYKTLFLGMMHFQDLYNHDVARVQRCDIHYVSPDGRLIPFCSFNVIPELYRDRVQKIYGIPIKKWEELKGMRLAEQKYKRNIAKLVKGEPYRRHYQNFFDVDSIPLEEHKKISLRFGIPVED